MIKSAHQFRNVLIFRNVNTAQIFNYISRHISLKQEEKDHFESVLKEQYLKKKAFILQQGNPCRYIHFVNYGILRAFHRSSQGKESTIMFASSDWWITDMPCFLNQTPAMVSIQVVQDCSILSISLSDLNRLYEKIPVFNSLFRVLMQNAYCREQLRMIQNLSIPAKERYESFLKKYPYIAQAVTSKQIASYLGITPEFLSSIRSQRA